MLNIGVLLPQQDFSLETMLPMTLKLFLDTIAKGIVLRMEAFAMFMQPIAPFLIRTLLMLALPPPPPPLQYPRPPRKPGKSEQLQDSPKGRQRFINNQNVKRTAPRKRQKQAPLN
jgi:hypothetical protein